MKRKEIIQDLNRLFKDVNRYILGEEFTSPKIDENGQPVMDEDGWPIMETKTDLRPWLKSSLRNRLEILEGKTRQFNIPDESQDHLRIMQSVLYETEDDRKEIIVRAELARREREGETILL